MDQEKSLSFVDKYGNGNAYLVVLQATYRNIPYIKVRQITVRTQRSFPVFSLPMDAAQKLANVINMGLVKEEFDEYGDETTQIYVERYYNCYEGWYIKVIRTVHSRSESKVLFNLPAKAAEKIADVIIAS